MASPEKQLQYDAKIKILMVGDSGVGKTCVLVRFADNSFQETFITTIGKTSSCESSCQYTARPAYSYYIAS